MANEEPLKRQISDIRLELLAPDITGGNDEPLKRLANIIDALNDDCCGCGWPAFISNILRGES